MSDTFTDSDGTVRLRGTFESGSVIDRTLTAAELLGAFAAPVEIIPAPGAGKFIYPLQLFQLFEPGATPYTSDFGRGIFAWGDGTVSTGWQADPSNFYGKTEPELRTYAGSSNFVPFADLEDAALVFMVIDEALAAGDGTVHVNLPYRIVEF